MAEFIIPIKSEELKAEILEAFAANFANNDGLTPEELALKHISNFIRHQLNEKRTKVTIETARASIVKEVSILPEPTVEQEIIDEVPVKKRKKKVVEPVVEEVPSE